MSRRSYIHCDQCNCDFSSQDTASWRWIEMMWPRDTHFCTNECAAKYFAERAGGSYINNGRKE